ncbi:MAG: hypothetical protein U0U70_09090 [Chitinophagaceae bacterium]
MRKYLIIILVAGCLQAGAQSKKTVQAMANSKLLVSTIFETRDSATLEKLFAPNMTHLNGAGTQETRSEAIRNIIHNPSKYVQATMTNGYGVSSHGDSTTVKFFYKGREYKADGSSVPFAVNLEMVWVKIKKNTTLYSLHTVKAE